MRKQILVAARMTINQSMKIHRDFNLSEVLWYKIGGTCKYFIDCESSNDIVDAFKFIVQEKIGKYFVVGTGANLLFTDEYYNGAVVRIGTVSSREGIKLVGKNVVDAFAGETLDSVIQFGFENNLVGLEWAGGLPGTVGAAVRGNVGAFGGEIKDSFSGGELLVLPIRSSVPLSPQSSPKGRGSSIEGKTIIGSGKISKVTRRDIKFAYRMSTIKAHKNLIVVSAQFKLKPATEIEVGRARQTYFANIEYRKLRHPLEYPNTGSVFKNVAKADDVAKVLEVFPDLADKIKIDWHGKVSMGYLNKRLDLAGLRIGNAEISQKHSNFINNLGGAKFIDVFTIIQKIKQTFNDTFGFIPDEEIEIVE